MAVYRHSYTHPVTRWGMRLEILPYNQDNDGSVTALDPLTVKREPLTCEVAFDALPLGLATAGDASVVLVLDNLPTALRSALITGTGGAGERNLFALLSDRGSGGATWTVEGLWVQTNIESAEYTKEAGYTLATYDLQDAVQYTAQTLEGWEPFATSTSPYTLANPSDTVREWPEVQQVNGTDRRPTQSHFVNKGAGDWRVQRSTWAYCAGLIRDALRDQFNTICNRSTNATTGYTVGAIDNTGLIQILGEALTFYETRDQNGYDREATTALDYATLSLITHVRDDTGEHVGGMFHRADEQGFGRWESVWDLLRDWSEACHVKVSWVYTYNTGGGLPYYSVSWRTRRPMAQDRVISGVPVDEGTFTLSRTGNETIRDGADTIGRAEIRVETYDDRDATAYVQNNSTTRGQRTVTIQAPFVTAPVMLPDTRDDRHGRDWFEYFTPQLKQTNLLCYYSSTTGQLTKVHEKTRVYLDESWYYEGDNPAESENPPAVSNAGGGGLSLNTTPASPAKAKRELEAWCVLLQNTAGHAYTQAGALVSQFGQRSQAFVEVTMPITSAGGLTERLGYIFTIDSDPLLTHIQYTRACAVSVSVDWNAGTVTFGLLCVPL